MNYISDGSTASYYVLPEGAQELQDLISERDMNAQIGEIFRACYRYGRCRHSDRLRDAKKILFYAQAEVARLEKLQGQASSCLEKPSWDDAPKWAQWLAQDSDSSWWWYEFRPEPEYVTGGWDGDEQGEITVAGVSEVIGDWHATLEGRP